MIASKLSRTVLRLSVFLAIGFCLSAPVIGLTIDAERSVLDARVAQLESLHNRLQERHARTQAADLSDLGEDAVLRRAQRDRGAPERFAHDIAPREAGLEFDGRILTSRSKTLRHHGGYTLFDMEVRGTVVTLVTAEPAIAEILASLPHDQQVWIRGDERLRLRHGHAMARRATRVIEISHFATQAEPLPLVARLAQPSVSLAAIQR